MPIFRLLGEASEVFTLQKQHIAPMAVKFGMHGDKIWQGGSTGSKTENVMEFRKINILQGHYPLYYFSRLFHDLWAVSSWFNC